MVIFNKIAKLLPVDKWKYPIIGGFIAAPLTAVIYWQSTNFLHLGPIFLAGLLTGYLGGQDRPSTTRIGGRAGMIAAVPGLWLLSDIFTTVNAASGPAWFQGATIILTTGLLVVIVGLILLFGGAGGLAGQWISKKI